MEEVKALLAAVKASGNSLPIAPIQSATSALTEKCIPEAGMKVFYKHLSYLSLHYPNSKAKRTAVIDLMRKLQETHTYSVRYCQYFCQDLEKHFTVSLEQGASLRHEAVFTLRCLAAQLISSCTGEANATTLSDISNAIISFAALLNARFTLGNRCHGIAKAVVRTAFSMFKLPRLRQLCFELLTQQSPNQHLIALSSLLVLYCHNSGIAQELSDKTSSLLQHYTQTCFITKEPVNSIHLLASSHLTQFLVDKQLMDSELMNLIKKAVLRSPEIALPTIASLLKCISIDLSKYSAELFDTFSTHLLADTDSVRNGTAECVQLLANQVSDTAQFGNLVERVCSQLVGNNKGKLSNPKHKLTLIRLVGGLSAAPSAAAASTALVDCLLNYLASEVQEGATIEAITSLNNCVSKLNDNNTVKRITDYVMESLQKKQAPTIRLQQFWLLRTMYANRSLQPIKSIKQQLIDAMQKSQKPQAVQLSAAAAAASLGEALISCEFALRLHSEGIADQDLLDAALTTAASSDGRLFSDHFVKLLINNYQLEQCCLQSAINTIGLLFSDYQQQQQQQAANKLLSALITAPSPAGNVRLTTCRFLSRQLNALGGDVIGASVLQCVLDCVNGVNDEYSVSVYDASQVYKNKRSTISQSATVPAKINSQLLLICAHESALNRHRLAWQQSCCSWPPELPDAISVLQQLGCTVHSLVDNRPSQLQLRAMQSLCSVSVESAKLLMQSALTNVSRAEVAAITQSDIELMRTADGVLYDNSVLEEALEAQKTASQSSKNVRRENKLYSYAEQMAEEQLRRDLAAKKNKGKQQGDKQQQLQQLDPKTAERVNEAIAAEKAKREQLKPIALSVEASFDWLLALVDISDVDLLQELLPQLIDCTVQMLHWPLTASRAVQLFESIVQTVAKVTSSSVDVALLHARALYHIAQPAVSAGSCYDWCSDAVLTRAIAVIKGEGEEEEGDEEDEKEEEEEEEDEEDDEAGASRSTELSLKFLCTLPLLRTLILQHRAEHEALTALHCIELHCKLMSRLKQQQQLPITELFQLLTQQLPLSANTLLTLCRCVNGIEITSASVNCLLMALVTNENLVAAHTVLTCLGLVTIERAAMPQLSTSLQQHLYIAKHMPDTAVQELANSTLAELFPNVEQINANGEQIVQFLLHNLQSHCSPVRTAAAAALHQCVLDKFTSVQLIIPKLFTIYHELSYRPPDVRDEFGRLVKERPPDRWQERAAIADAMLQQLPGMNSELVLQLFDNIVNCYLKDESQQVRDLMLRVGQECVKQHGAGNLPELVQLFEQFLQNAPNDESYDSVRQGVVILLGQLAKFLDPVSEEQKIRKIFIKLLETLSFPSQTVQEAVSTCLPPLMQAMKHERATIIEKLMQQILEAESYAERKGAAYGLAGVTKGVGISVLKEMQINNRLLEAMKDKKSVKHREGALLALEQICYVWGRLFEPYVVHILPSLLICCGDSVSSVRQAADDCSIAVMSKLSNHGVKLVLPSLLSTLAEDNWRTKCASAELLGSMSYCAPKQLSACLPQIVPKLMEVLTDSHRRVQQAGEEAIGKIGKVITNPEVRGIVPQLLEAIKEPDRCTTDALSVLLTVQFIHKIDSASLALIMPVIGRAFRDTNTDTRKTAAEIIGNIYRLTEKNDLSPYMEAILPGLKRCLLDPVPGVRAVAAKALGSMVKEMGENSFQDLFPWLMSTLVTEDSAINRAGAAQGLAEIIGGAGAGKLDSLMPEMISTAEKPDIAPHVRDGYLMLFIYLPKVFRTEFASYVGASLPPILKGLANEIEFVRDTALKAGQILVQLYSKTAISLLLPKLESGMFDENWRIRFSSVQLLGDLLYNLSGASGKGTSVTDGDDDTFGSSRQFARIEEQLGEKRRNKVLAGLYMTRSDSALQVRNSANHVWKVIVPHTPRTLQAIMPDLLPILLANLASSGPELREVSAKTLGDIVRKLGDRILSQMMHMLQSGLGSDAKQREGVCLALSEIMCNVGRDQMLAYDEQLIPTVLKALTDELPSVRSAAARTFALLYSVIGQRALDEIILRMLNMMGDSSGEAELALDGLKQVMATKSDIVLPYIIPKLVQPPVNIKALAVLASVAGASLTQHLGKILPALVAGLDPNDADQLQQCQSVIANVSDEQGVIVCVRQLVNCCDSVNQLPANQKVTAAKLLTALVNNDEVDIDEYREQVLRACLRLYCMQSAAVLCAAHDCLKSLIDMIDKAELPEFVQVLRNTVRHVLSEPVHRHSVLEVPGFCCTQPKGVTPVLNVYREGLLSGTIEQKETASLGLRELIERTSAEALKSHVVQITGPLIRVLGDRYPSNLKSAIIDALSTLLQKCANILKPFLPQLQLTFFKALSDQTYSLRLKAAVAIGQLSCVHAKPDQLLTELANALAKPENADAKFTNLQAIRHSLLNARDRLSSDTCSSLFAELKKHTQNDDEAIRVTSGACIGLLAAAAQKSDSVLSYLTQQLTAGSWLESQARLTGLTAYVTVADAALVSALLQTMEPIVVAALSSDRLQILDAAVRCCAAVLAKIDNGQSVLVNAMVKVQKHESSDIKLLISRSISYIAINRSDQQLIDQQNAVLITKLLSAMVNGTREKNAAVKFASEQAIADLCRLHQAEHRLNEQLVELVDAAMQDSIAQVVNALGKKQWQCSSAESVGIDKAAVTE